MNLNSGRFSCAPPVALDSPETTAHAGNTVPHKAPAPPWKAALPSKPYKKGASTGGASPPARPAIPAKSLVRGRSWASESPGLLPNNGGGSKPRNPTGIRTGNPVLTHSGGAISYRVTRNPCDWWSSEHGKSPPGIQYS